MCSSSWIAYLVQRKGFSILAYGPCGCSFFNLQSVPSSRSSHCFTRRDFTMATVLFSVFVFLITWPQQLTVTLLLTLCSCLWCKVQRPSRFLSVWKTFCSGTTQELKENVNVKLIHTEAMNGCAFVGGHQYPQGVQHVKNLNGKHEFTYLNMYKLNFELDLVRYELAQHCKW